MARHETRMLLLGAVALFEPVNGYQIRRDLMPVLLLSGILLPMSFGAQWLETLSDLMPTKHIVDAVRAAFFGDDDSSMLWGVGWTAVLFGLAVWWGTSVFKKENA